MRGLISPLIINDINLADNVILPIDIMWFTDKGYVTSFFLSSGKSCWAVQELLFCTVDTEQFCSHNLEMLIFTCFVDEHFMSRWRTWSM